MDVMSTGHLELGQSVPLETNLAIPGVKNALDIWNGLLSEARESIDIEAFYIKTKRGTGFDDFLLHILDRALEGIRVRILVDKAFFERDKRDSDDDHKGMIFKLQNARNVQIKLKAGIFGGQGKLHSKILINDGQHSWIGSQNYDWRSLDHIQELGVACYGSELSKCLQSIFELDWDGEIKGTIRASDHTSQQCIYEGHKHDAAVTASPPAWRPECTLSDLEEIIRYIREGQRIIRIQVSKYRNTMRGSAGHNWPILENELLAAASRGVAIKLIVDRRTLQDSVQTESLRQLAKQDCIDVRVATVPIHSSGQIAFARMVHSKLVVIDDQFSWIGTSNLAPDDFLFSRNIGLVVLGRRFAAASQRCFDHVWLNDFTEDIFTL